MDAVCGVSACTRTLRKRAIIGDRVLLAFFVMLTLGSESRDSDMKIIRFQDF